MLRLRILLPLALIVLFTWSAASSWMMRTVHHPPGVLAPREPQQTPPMDKLSFKRDGYEITPLADYWLTARLLGRQRYFTGREADLSPIDFALGWGLMSDSQVLDRLEIGQGGRAYYWNTKSPDLKLEDILSHSANVHLLPSSPEVKDKLLDFRPGELVTLVGKLVRVEHPDGWHWDSSLSRTDMGDGSCEVLWVDKAFR